MGRLVLSTDGSDVGVIILLVNLQERLMKIGGIITEALIYFHFFVICAKEKRKNKEKENKGKKKSKKVKVKK